MPTPPKLRTNQNRFKRMSPLYKLARAQGLFSLGGVGIPAPGPSTSSFLFTDRVSHSVEAHGSNQPSYSRFYLFSISSERMDREDEKRLQNRFAEDTPRESAAPRNEPRKAFKGADITPHEEMGFSGTARKAPLLVHLEAVFGVGGKQTGTESILSNPSGPKPRRQMVIYGGIGAMQASCTGSRDRALCHVSSRQRSRSAPLRKGPTKMEWSQLQERNNHVQGEEHKDDHTPVSSADRRDPARVGGKKRGDAAGSEDIRQECRRPSDRTRLAEVGGHGQLQRFYSGQQAQGYSTTGWHRDKRSSYPPQDLRPVSVQQRDSTVRYSGSSRPREQSSDKKIHRSAAGTWPASSSTSMENKSSRRRGKSHEPKGSHPYGLTDVSSTGAVGPAGFVDTTEPKFPPYWYLSDIQDESSLSESYFYIISSFTS